MGERQGDGGWVEHENQSYLAFLSTRKIKAT